MRVKVVLAFLLILVVSELANIIGAEVFHSVPPLINICKLAVLLLVVGVSFFVKKWIDLRKYMLTLIMIVAMYVFLKHDYIIQFFDTSTFVGSISSNILWKVIFSLPIIVLLLVMNGHPRQSYLVPGNLNIKATQINWLGLADNRISWLKLSVISALCISSVTFFLTLITVTGFKVPDKLMLYPGYLPFIIGFALVNSFTEGIMCRNAILASLKGTMDKKWILLISAVFFGLLHYYGVPAGVVGVCMSGLLGWYLSRSMYETGGFLAPWIMHFMIDFVVFTSLFLFGNFTV